MRVRRLLTTILVCLVSAYLAALAYLAINQRRLVFHPNADMPVLASETRSMGFQEVQLTNTDGMQLTAWYRPGSPGRATIVYFHGNAGNLGDRIERVRPYVQDNFGVFLVGYRGYGGNPGRPTEVGLYVDGRAHIAWLNSQGIARRDMVFYGESLGAAVALQMAIEEAPAGLVLEAPFASILASARERFPLFAFDWLIKDKFANIDKIGALRTPLLLIHGGQDKVTAFKFGQQLYGVAPEPKFAFWVPDAGHGDLMQHGMPQRVIEFLSWIDGTKTSATADQG